MPIRRSRIRLVSVLATVAVLAVAATVLAPTPTASAGSERFPGVKFVLDYRGSISGTWRQSAPVVGGLTCKGQDVSGSFTSSVRPAGAPYQLRLYKEFRSLEYAWRPANPKGLVTSNRTAQGWMMRYSGGQCRQQPMDESGCGSHSFLGHVRLSTKSRYFDLRSGTAYLTWEYEPHVLHCNDGIFYDPRYDAWGGAPLAAFSMKQLHRCGMAKPRRCRMTIRSSSDYPYSKVQQGITYTSSVHVEWSVTFRAVGRS